MVKIDSHQHFWKYDPSRESWITEEMSVIRKNFLPGDLYPFLDANSFDGCIAVQSDQSEADNEFLLALADQNNFIRGVVGWIDLTSEVVESRIAHYKQFKKFKGVRHVLQAESQRDYMLRPSFLRGLNLLQKYQLAYDILIYPDQLEFMEEFIRNFSDEQVFVLDHIAKPNIKDKSIGAWKKGIEAIARFPNLYCKVSGMVTEADWTSWKASDFTPYLNVIFESFGIERVLFGSDWPVCLVASSYEKTVQLLEDYMSKFSDFERSCFWGKNAVKAYNLEL